MPNNDYILRRDVLNEFHEWIVSNDGNIFSLADAFEVIPAADMEPVRHGKWIKVYGLVACSVCKKNPPRTYHNFCPNCGAKMDKEENHD